MARARQRSLRVRVVWQHCIKKRARNQQSLLFSTAWPCVVVASKKQKTIPYFVVNQQLTTDGFLFCLFFHITKELNLKVGIDVLF